MPEQQFVSLCKKPVADYANAHLDKSDGKQITEDDVFIVWMCKTLQNSKALVSTTLFDGMYYELTYNGDKKELYLDAYKKWENVVAEYANQHLDKSDGKQITADDVFIVWMCKTLQNSKALVSTTLFDGMYYELTYNGNKKELYLDAYKKWENKAIPVT